jgi:putative transposase
VGHVTAKLDVSERIACKVLEQHRSTRRKVPRTADDEAALTADIIALAKQSGEAVWPLRLSPNYGSAES